MDVHWLAQFRILKISPQLVKDDSIPTAALLVPVNAALAGNFLDPQVECLDETSIHNLLDALKHDLVGFSCFLLVVLISGFFKSSTVISTLFGLDFRKQQFKKRSHI